MSMAMTPSISGDDGGDHRFGHVLGKNSMLTQNSYSSMYLNDVANTTMDRSRSSGMNDGGYFLMQGVPSMNYMGHMRHHVPFVPTDDIFAVQSESPDSHVPSAKNDDLNLESDYERLYLNRMHNDSGEEGKDYGGRITEKNHYMNATEKPRSHKIHVRGKKGQVGGALDNGVGVSNRRLEAGTALELTELLVSCAQAVSVGDSLRAFGTLQQLRKNGVSPNGNGLHRVIYYFCEALEVRMNGLGTRAYFEAAYGNQLSVSTLLKVTKTALNFIPMFKIAHYFANQSILKAAEGATSLHIVDYGMFFGLQWPCLINALADRNEGPPMLTITAIGFPQPGDNPAKQLEDIGDRLSEYAKTYNVPFKYHAIAASNWEDLDLLSHTAHNGVEEVLVVNCIHSLHHVLDECILASDKSTSCPRQRLLEKVCKLSPNLFVMASLNAAHNSPFFVPRFKEALNYYCSKFDMVDTVWDNSPERMTIEKDCFYRDILNVIACEGPERVERPEMYKQWQARIERAGFLQMPIMPIMLPRSRAFLKKYYHKDFHIDHSANCWMLLSWKGRTMEAISAWKPRIMHN
ncbi:hypothetical protein KP509_31G022300 [Ceratopteris richardii]|nr:hypothetical protein KP509_31G022300 [Ceratopteris richardii]